jgi:hypothetical protein
MLGDRLLRPGDGLHPGPGDGRGHPPPARLPPGPELLGPAPHLLGAAQPLPSPTHQPPGGNAPGWRWGAGIRGPPGALPGGAGHREPPPLRHRAGGRGDGGGRSDLAWDLPFLERALERVLGSRRDGGERPAALRMEGELAVSLPDPNISGDAYLDDFDGGDERTVSLLSTNWHLGSVPAFRDGAGDILPEVMDAASALPLVWQHSWVEEGPAGDSIGSSRASSPAPTSTGRSPSPGARPGSRGSSSPSVRRRGHPAEEPRWRSFTTLLSPTGTDLTQTEYLEFYVAEGDALTLVVDLGLVSEDAYFIDENGNTSGFRRHRALLGTGGPGPGGGPPPGEIWDPTADQRGVWPEDVPGRAGSGLSPGGPPGELHPGNGRRDTEDLNGNGVLDTEERYARYVIRLDGTSPYLARDRAGTGTRFRRYRIPLRGPGAIYPAGGFSQADWRNVQFLRVTVAGRAGVPPHPGPDAPGGIPVGEAGRGRGPPGDRGGYPGGGRGPGRLPGGGALGRGRLPAPPGGAGAPGRPLLGGGGTGSGVPGALPGPPVPGPGTGRPGRGLFPLPPAPPGLPGLSGDAPLGPGPGGGLGPPGRDGLLREGGKRSGELLPLAGAPGGGAGPCGRLPRGLAPGADPGVQPVDRPTAAGGTPPGPLPSGPGGRSGGGVERRLHLRRGPPGPGPGAEPGGGAGDLHGGLEPGGGPHQRRGLDQRAPPGGRGPYTRRCPPRHHGAGWGRPPAAPPGVPGERSPLPDPGRGGHLPAGERPEPVREPPARGESPRSLGNGPSPLLLPLPVRPGPLLPGGDRPPGRRLPEPPHGSLPGVQGRRGQPDAGDHRLRGPGRPSPSAGAQGRGLPERWSDPHHREPRRGRGRGGAGGRPAHPPDGGTGPRLPGTRGADLPAAELGPAGERRPLAVVPGGDPGGVRVPLPELPDHPLRPDRGVPGAGGRPPPRSGAAGRHGGGPGAMARLPGPHRVPPGGTLTVEVDVESRRDLLDPLEGVETQRPVSWCRRNGGASWGRTWDGRPTGISRPDSASARSPSGDSGPT